MKNIPACIPGAKPFQVSVLALAKMLIPVSKSVLNGRRFQLREHVLSLAGDPSRQYRVAVVMEQFNQHRNHINQR